MTEICTVFQFIDFCCIKLSHQGRPPQLCISQFHLGAASPPPGYCGAALSVPGVFATFRTARRLGICQPRGNSRAFDTHAVSYQNITTQKVLLEKRLIGSSVKDRNKLKRAVKACSRFYACISSLLIKIT